MYIYNPNSVKFAKNFVTELVFSYEQSYIREFRGERVRAMLSSNARAPHGIVCNW